jgi:hypothetical protein
MAARLDRCGGRSNICGQQRKRSPDRGLRAGAQFGRQLDPHPVTPAKVEDFAGWDRASGAFLQAQRLRAQLYMIVEPFAQLAVLVLDRRQHTVPFFEQVGEAGQLQAIAVDIDTALDRTVVGGFMARRMRPLVLQRAFKHIRVLFHLAFHEHVPKAPLAVFELIQETDR